MSEYRDYGALVGASMTDVPVDTKHIGQVYQATHGGDNNRLPLMRRSFISFTFSNPGEELVYIEDFNLLATISNNRLERNGYSSFKDLTTSYDMLDGQLYWNTHYQTNTITFNLATDGIDQKMLDKFLHWFSAGVTRELILSEHPNRAQMARVSEPPHLSLLPFEHKITTMIGGQGRSITTTLYKGDITLTLIMDDPHWYAIDNILGQRDNVPGEGYTSRYIDIWLDRTTNPPHEVDIFASQDALKILYEDGIPLGSMIQNNMLLGNGAYADVENAIETKIWSIADDADISWTDGVPDGYGARIQGIVTQQYKDEMAAQGIVVQSAINDQPGDLPYLGKIAGAIVDVTGTGISALYSKDDNNEFHTPKAGYFYYAGTAPAPAKITFTFVPNIVDDAYHYIIAPFNKIENRFNNTVSNELVYNTFTIESIGKQELHFTTPNVLTSYNEAVYLLSNNITVGSTTTWDKMYSLIRDRVRHPAVRAWVTEVLNEYEKKFGTAVEGADPILSIDPALLDDILTCLSYFLCSNTGETLNQTVSFNSKTGEALGYLNYREFEGTLITEDNTNENDVELTLVQQFLTFGTVSLHIEDVGDMLQSNYLLIRDRNYPNEDGFVVSRDDSNEYGHGYSHKITHDFPGAITNLQIEYKNMYL